MDLKHANICLIFLSWNIWSAVFVSLLSTCPPKNSHPSCRLQPIWIATYSIANLPSTVDGIQLVPNTVDINVDCVCIFKFAHKALFQENAKEYYLNLYVFSPLCFQMRFLKVSAWEDAKSHWLHLLDFFHCGLADVSSICSVPCTLHSGLKCSNRFPLRNLDVSLPAALQPMTRRKRSIPVR